MTDAPNIPTSGRKMGEKKSAELSDTQQKHILYRGATVSDLEIIFKLDRRTIIKRIEGVQPCGKRAQADIFLIRECAPYLVKPAGDMGEFIKNARSVDLPPLLQKEYWNGLRAKQDFLLREGDVWRTEQVQGLVAEAFKVVRNNLMLMPDQLALKTTISDVQRTEILEMLDSTIAGIKEALLNVFDVEPETGDEPGSTAPEHGMGAKAPDDGDDDFWDDPAEDPEDSDGGL